MKKLFFGTAILLCVFTLFSCGTSDSDTFETADTSEETESNHNNGESSSDMLQVASNLTTDFFGGVASDSTDVTSSTYSSLLDSYGDYYYEALGYSSSDEFEYSSDDETCGAFNGSFDEDDYYGAKAELILNPDYASCMYNVMYLLNSNSSSTFDTVLSVEDNSTFYDYTVDEDSYTVQSTETTSSRTFYYLMSYDSDNNELDLYYTSTDDEYTLYGDATYIYTDDDNFYFNMESYQTYTDLDSTSVDYMINFEISKDEGEFSKLSNFDYTQDEGMTCYDLDLVNQTVFGFYDTELTNEDFSSITTEICETNEDAMQEKYTSNLSDTSDATSIESDEVVVYASKDSYYFYYICGFDDTYDMVEYTNTLSVIENFYFYGYFYAYIAEDDEYISANATLYYYLYNVEEDTSTLENLSSDNTDYIAAQYLYVLLYSTYVDSNGDSIFGISTDFTADADDTVLYDYIMEYIKSDVTYLAIYNNIISKTRTID